MTKFADLHIHTYYSDGTSSPKEIVDQACNAGLACVAITDHDTVAGIEPVRVLARDSGLDVIAGIELSSEMNSKDVHILGYLFDYKDEYFIRRLQEMQDSRLDRMDEMIAKLKDLGIEDINLDEVANLAKIKSLGRPHLAQILVEKGVVPNLKKAFDLYLADGAPAYVPKFKQTPYEAIHLIKDAGGLAVLAHPMITAVDELIPSLIREGLDGIEAYYPNYPENIVRFYEGIAQKHQILVTGGSDAHGEARKHTFVGRIKVPYALVDKMKERANQS